MAAPRIFGRRRPASAKAPNGRRSSANTSGPCRSTVTHRAQPSRAYPAGCRQERWSAAPRWRTAARPRAIASRPHREWSGGRTRECRPPLLHEGPYRALSPYSPLVIRVVVTPPETRVVAPLGGAVEPLVHAP